jgi:DNA-binding HxlR family transcriptional regulator
MRSYGQYCALARALDIVGERWTLLVIRELFARDCRYSDLREGLPGIATNLLADRLRHLDAAGLIEAYEAPSPVRATMYRLTDRGRALGPTLRALLVWGAPLVAEPQGQDGFRTHWLALALPQLFAGADLAGVGDLKVLVHTGDEPALLEVRDGSIDMHSGAELAGVEADVTVEGTPEGVYAVLTGASPDDASARVTGRPGAVRRLRHLAARLPGESLDKNK